MIVSWTEFKSIIDQNSGNHSNEFSDSKYKLLVINAGVSINCDIDRDPSDTTDLDDYELNYLSLANKRIESFYQREPFASKHLADGSSLFRRKHGQRVSCPANSTTNIDMVVPYDNCKINKIEIINANDNDTINLKVLDTPTGTFSTVPYYMLNQFGFDVCVCSLIYADKSDYEASLIKDMTVRAEYKNYTNSDVTIGVNFILHEVVS